MLSFFLAIFIGSVLLALPISGKGGVAVDYIDALFTATSATCVTGLVTLPTVSAWSTFGHVVILILIQIGGLGIITVISGLAVALHRKFGFKDSLLISDAFNLTTLEGLSRFITKVILGTFIIEGIGALLYMLVFIPDFGVARGIWISVFTSVSAFCNAGLDIIAVDSLCGYATNPLINTVTCMLIILGGIGYIVWWDFIRVSREFKNQGFKCFRRLTLHSKIAISTTAVLILFGAVMIFAFEYNNPATIGEMSLPQKIQAAFFQSITTRTAGFATIPQENLTNGSAFTSLVLMFIGGSPVGTAGGIKTVTIAVLFFTALSIIANRNEVVLFNRSLTNTVTRKAVAVAITSFAIVVVSTLLLSFTIDAPALDVLYEVVSANATVGLSRGITPLLNTFGKLIITFTMYFGRVGPISLVIAFSYKKEIKNNIKEPTEKVSVG